MWTIKCSLNQFTMERICKQGIFLDNLSTQLFALYHFHILTSLYLLSYCIFFSVYMKINIFLLKVYSGDRNYGVCNTLKVNEWELGSYAYFKTHVMPMGIKSTFENIYVWSSNDMFRKIIPVVNYSLAKETLSNIKATSVFEKF